jgi:dUTP pyrophosphatase
MSQYTLYIKPTTDTAKKYYKENAYFHQGDSGIDLFVPYDVTFKPFETKFVDLQIQCEMKCGDNNVSYYLYPRSSISKTPLILANSVGIIDAGYRGNIIAALRYIPQQEIKDTTYVLLKNTRIVQICSPTLTPLNSELVENLSNTTRGENGFGSTGI